MGIPIKATEIRTGTKLEIDGEVYSVTKFEHHTPGKGQAVVRLKYKHLKTGRVLDKTVRSGEMLEKASLVPRKVQFLYKDDMLNFMDSETYEQFSLTPEALLGKDVWLKENTELTLLCFNDDPVDVDIPLSMELEIVETDPGLRGDTASGGSKPATVETGAVIQVPLFINIGDKVRVDTRDGSYIERV
ncbi:MAG: elongation factor P [bacterium]|jgi:elongation factor P|nr:elongation factor P [bacterium]